MVEVNRLCLQETNKKARIVRAFEPLSLGLVVREKVIGGEIGIRTLDTLLTYTHFPGVLLQPLGHLTI